VSGKPVSAGLAESWDVSADGERITVKLRSGARWHDDHVVSGVDVQATFEPLLRAGSRQPLLHAMLEDVEAVDVLPERAARFRPAPAIGPGSACPVRNSDPAR
jgi:ABC-type transport system substrate-binding protein